MSLTLGRSS